MQLNNVTRPVISSGTMQVAQATIKSSRKVFDMFSDQTYANKPVAIARELVANGIDAHVAAGTPDRQVEVIMPTELEPEFKVRDFGTGMSHDFVMGPFMAYTDGSTKDKSNDQIGGFGIGSKSPFAYTDQFTLRVVHDSVLSVYTMFKDEDGIPSVGLVAQTTTDEHNGVEVSFPVELDDMEDFQSATQTALQYFHPLPIVHNGTLTPPDYSHVSAGGKWAMRPTSGALGVIMGGVRYPVATDSLPWSLKQGKVAPLLDYGIDLTLPIGAADVAMSRESLSYTDRTSTAITAALTDIVDEVAATFATLFDKYNTLWDAKVALYKEVQNLGGGSRGYNYSGGRTGMLRQYAKYKGLPLTMDIEASVTSRWDHNTKAYIYTYPTGFPQGMQVWTAQLRSYGVQRMPTPKFQTFGTDLTSITPGAWPHLLVDDMPTVGKSRTRARVQEWLENNSKSGVLVLRAGKNEDKKEIAAMLSYLGNPTVTYLSSLPEPVRKVAVRGATGMAMVVRPKVRMFKFNGENDTYGNRIVNLSPAHAKRDAVKEIPYADQPDTGVLVVCEAWNFPEGFIKKMNTGVVKWDELVFVNTSDAPKLKGSKFKQFDAVFEPRFKKEKAKYPDLPKWLAISDDEALKRWFQRINNYRSYWKLTPEQEATPFGQLVKLYDENYVPLTYALRSFAIHAEIKAEKPDDFDGEALRDAADKAHPFMLSVFNLIHYGGVSEERANLLLNNL